MIRPQHPRPRSPPLTVARPRIRSWIHDLLAAQVPRRRLNPAPETSTPHSFPHDASIPDPRGPRSPRRTVTRTTLRPRTPEPATASPHSCPHDASNPDPISLPPGFPDNNSIRNPRPLLRAVASTATRTQIPRTVSSPGCPTENSALDPRPLLHPVAQTETRPWNP